MSIRCKEFIGTLSGNASTATKDSAGQQINTTYIKGLSVSGTTITYTKGDGTTGTIKTQDTDTVYTHPTTHPASMITGLATVATSGSYNDLTNKPTIPAAYSLPDATTSVKGGVKIGSNLTVSSGTISLTKANVTNALGYTPPTTDTNTTYSAGTGISLSGTTFSNAGVRSIATGSANGTISVNTNGTSADVAVKGLGSAAYMASSAYATSNHTHSNYVPTSDVANSANKIPRYNASGHLVLPDGSEFWIA